MLKADGSVASVSKVSATASEMEFPPSSGDLFGGAGTLIGQTSDNTVTIAVGAVRNAAVHFLTREYCPLPTVPVQSR